MKRVLALLIAVVMVFGLNMLVSAAPIALGASNEVSVANNEIVIVNSKTKALVLPETRLLPGHEYTFNLYRVTAGGAGFVNPSTLTLTPITRGELAGGRLRIRGSKGTSAITSAKIEEKGTSATGTFNLVITTRENYGTKITDVEYTITATGMGAGAATFVDGSAILKTGYPRFTDTEIDTYSEGDIITIIPDEKVVILKDQFSTLAKAYNYKAVEFEAEDAGWSYTGRISGMTDTNFTYTHDVLPSIINKLPDQDFKFLTFPAGVTFPTTGEFRIDVSDVSGEFQRMYTYLYRNGMLTRVNATYDTGADEIVFRTNYLGAFVITNEEITDTTIVEHVEPTTPAPTTPTEPTEPPLIHNPNTGAGNVGALASAMSLIALASAVALRKKR